MLDGILDPVVSPLRQIIMGLLQVVELVVYLITKFPKLLAEALNIFDISKLINDIVGGIFASIMLVFNAVINMLSPRALIKKHAPKNKQPSTGIFGFPKPKKNGKYINPLKSGDRRCFPPTLARLLLMILCPPFALFTHVGLKGILYVIICTILTIYGYYFPGLIYAALHILC